MGSDPSAHTQPDPVAHFQPDTVTNGVKTLWLCFRLDASLREGWQNVSEPLFGRLRGDPSRGRGPMCSPPGSLIRLTNEGRNTFFFLTRAVVRVYFSFFLLRSNVLLLTKLLRDKEQCRGNATSHQIIVFCSVTCDEHLQVDEPMLMILLSYLVFKLSE